MGIYTRPDSPFYWYLIEGTGRRGSTGVPTTGGSPMQDRELRRQADTIYAAMKTEQAKQAVGLAFTHLPIAFAKYADWYDTHEVTHHRSAEKERSIVRQLRRYFDRFDRLASIDADAVKEWMSWRKRQVKAATVNRELDVLKSLLRSAVPKYLAASPIAGLRRFRVPEGDPRILSHDEEDRLLAICGPEDKAFILTAIDTLWRLSNVVYLQWGQVKFEFNLVVPLNAKINHDGNPITARLKPALQQLRRQNDWVFPQFHARGQGQSAAKNRAIRKFLLLCQQAQIPHSRAANGVTFHSLRHTGATRALQYGASVRTVMKLGGWKDERSVMRYVHAADLDVRVAAESISRRPNHVKLA